MIISKKISEEKLKEMLWKLYRKGNEAKALNTKEFVEEIKQEFRKQQADLGGVFVEKRI